jgi:protein-tyrosine phosphatase
MGYQYLFEKLAQGSVPHEGAHLAQEFDVVVLCAMEHQNVYLPGVEVLRCPLDDARPTTAEVRRAWRTAHRVARRIEANKRVLVTCHMGWNRSGLVSALTLRVMGFTPREAVHVVRKARGLRALGNKDFVHVICQTVPPVAGPPSAGVSA